MSTAAPAAERAFLDAILADPGDDVPRLILADFLEGRGGPGDAERAEFVRVQCELAAHPEGYEPLTPDNRVWVLRRRERELGDALQPYFRGAFLDMLGMSAPNGFGWTWRRGFVAAVTLPAADFLRHAAALFACQPVEAVTLADREPTHYTRPDGPGYWRWFDGSRTRRGRVIDFPSDTDADELPGTLWREYDVLSDDGDFTWEHPTRGDALLWLSRACVVFGRRAAGLPPLPPPG